VVNLSIYLNSVLYEAHQGLIPDRSFNTDTNESVVMLSVISEVRVVNICLEENIEHVILVSSAFGVYRRWNSHPKAYRWKLPQTNAYYAFICKYIFMKIRMHVVHSLKNTPIKFLWQNNVCSFRYSVLKSANNTQCSVFKYTKVWIHIRDQLLHVYRTNIILCLQVSIKYTCILF